MEWLIIACLVFIYVLINEKFNLLIAEVRKMGKEKVRGDKMNELLKKHIGKKCTYKGVKNYSVEVNEKTIIDVDEEWISFQSEDKKGNLVTKVLRIEDTKVLGY